jgi:hypothetical protein
MFTINNKEQDFNKKARTKKHSWLDDHVVSMKEKEGLIVGVTIYIETIWERGLRKEPSTKEKTSWPCK